MAKLAALLVVLGLGAFWGYTAHETAAAEKTLAAIATPLAGRQVGIECQGFWAALFSVDGNLGHVRFPDGVHPEDHANLTRSICGWLRNFAGQRSKIACLAGSDWGRASLADAIRGPCGSRAKPVAEAVLTLAHEAMHLRGIQSEGVAQCYGIQEIPYVVVRLGGTPEDGAALAAYAMALQQGMPQEYRSSECHAGGRLDLHPETAEFPG
jgi:hypothetical protein